MARIRIKDLARDQKISKAELKRIKGGFGVLPVIPKLEIKINTVESDIKWEGTVQGDDSLLSASDMLYLDGKGGDITR